MLNLFLSNPTSNHLINFQGTLLQSIDLNKVRNLKTNFQPPSSLQLTKCFLNCIKKDHHSLHHKHKLQNKNKGVNEPCCVSCEKRKDCKKKECCWHCNQELESNFLFCSGCKKLQPPNEKSDYFELLGVEKRFDLDINKLNDSFKNLQKQVHPDKFHFHGGDEHRFSKKISTNINRAYKTLKKDNLRAKYMLELNGISSEQKIIHDPELLMDALEKRQLIETAESPVLEKMQKENEKEKTEIKRKLAKAFLEKNLSEAENYTIKLQYLVNLEEQLNDKLF
ncbi:iron-sulfur cluster co-chaperone protein hscb [Anaeramoeba flamelloides]|uniref:Iron-sulfur cluster co-chaperone protein hscb n=1 Tax=Anaeramoeba flamelloides TaxID=1746091 RepID=A0AAV7YWD2_9EUKA|nr:iron-sulfur cluster co-chaperone protein hscb [Anaeramoeba flamelloides]